MYQTLEIAFSYVSPWSQINRYIIQKGTWQECATKPRKKKLLTTKTLAAVRKVFTTHTSHVKNNSCMLFAVLIHCKLLQAFWFTDELTTRIAVINKPQS